MWESESEKLDNKLIRRIMRYTDYKNIDYTDLYKELISKNKLHYDTCNIVKNYISNIVYIISRSSKNGYIPHTVFCNLYDAKVAFIYLANMIYKVSNKQKKLTISSEDDIITLESLLDLSIDVDEDDKYYELIKLKITRCHVRKVIK
jgi:hypothetical protein